MPTLQSLNIHRFRNISSAELQLDRGLNIFHGDNGSGKTSLLEAVYVLGLARSFRSSSQRPLVMEGNSEAVVSGRLSSGLTLGVRKAVTGKQEVKVGGEKAGSAASLARELPMLVVNTDTFSILDGSPKTRRGFLDWGVFHVEQRFLDCWRQMIKALQNRNSVIKAGGSSSEIDPWTKSLADYGSRIDQDRAAYLKALTKPFKKALGSLSPVLGGRELMLGYIRGWPEDISLLDALHQSEDKDRRYGYTTVGPHRADIKFTLDGVAAQDRLSRGQQKLMVCALKLAQAQLLKEHSGQQCLFLIDDLPAELDASNRRRLCELIDDQEQQALITCIDPDQLGFLLNSERKIGLFHVKHGRISSQ